MTIPLTGKCVLLLATISITCGCTTSRSPSILQAEDGSAMFVDASKRGVYQVQRSKPGSSEVFNGFCAEPSPDALTTLAANLGIDASAGDGKSAGVAASITDDIGSIGIRTSAIQALRDIMYRNCEAYALGAVSTVGLETLQRRFQSTMIAVLAIEQLTGVVHGSADTTSTAISDSAAASIASAVRDIVIASTSELAYTRELCVTVLGEYANVSPEPGSTLAACLKLLGNNVLNLQAPR